MAKKFKLKYYKCLFARRMHRGESDNKIVDYHFGNRHTEKLNHYEYHKYDMNWFFSDELDQLNDNRSYQKNSKFTESEATQLLLMYIEKKLKECQNDKRRNDRLLKNMSDNSINGIIRSAGILEYSLKVNRRELKFFKEAAKIYRKKMKTIKESPEYIWEQLYKWVKR